MYKLNDGLPHYVKLYKQDLSFNQTLPQNSNADGNLGQIEVGGINSSIEIIARAHTKLAVATTKKIEISLSHSDDGSAWSVVGSIRHIVAAVTIKKSEDTTILEVTLTQVNSKTKLKISTDVIFSGKISATYNNNLGKLFDAKELPGSIVTELPASAEIAVDNSSVVVMLHVVARDLSVSEEGTITMTLQKEVTVNTVKSWVDLVADRYKLEAARGISAGTELWRYALPSTVKRFLKANVLTDDGACTGSIDVLMTYLPR